MVHDPALVPGAYYAILQLTPTGEGAPSLIAASPEGPLVLQGGVIATQPSCLQASNFQVPTPQDFYVTEEVPIIQPDHNKAGA